VVAAALAPAQLILTHPEMIQKIAADFFWTDDMSAHLRSIA
jgi:hypothetical protein